MCHECLSSQQVMGLNSGEMPLNSFREIKFFFVFIPLVLNKLGIKLPEIKMPRDTSPLPYFFYSTSYISINPNVKSWILSNWKANELVCYSFMEANEDMRHLGR